MGICFSRHNIQNISNQPHTTPANYERTMGTSTEISSFVFPQSVHAVNSHRLRIRIEEYTGPPIPIEPVFYMGTTTKQCMVRCGRREINHA
jgi:hypothetical protein